MRTEHCLNYMLLIIIMLRLMMEYLWCMWLMMHYIVICNSTLILSLHCNRHCKSNCTPLMQQTDLWDCLQGCWYCPQCCDHHHLCRSHYTHQCTGMLTSYSAPTSNHAHVHFSGQIPFSVSTDKFYEALGSTLEENASYWPWLLLYNLSYFFPLKGPSTSSSIIMNPLVSGECIKGSLQNIAKSIC